MSRDVLLGWLSFVQNGTFNAESVPLVNPSMTAIRGIEEGQSCMPDGMTTCAFDIFWKCEFIRKGLMERGISLFLNTPQELEKAAENRDEDNILFEGSSPEFVGKKKGVSS